MSKPKPVKPDAIVHPKRRIRHRDPRELNPAPYNPRIPIEGEARAKLRAGLEEFGFVQPVVVNTRNGRDRIVGGHQRVTIAIEDLAWPEVPVLEIDVDDDRERALNILLNNERAQSTYDLPALVESLESLEHTPMLELTGFDFDQYQQLQIDAGAATKIGREGTVPTLPDRGAKTRTRPGDVWRLGIHLLVVGDAADPGAYTWLPEPAQLLFTDPPYNVDYVGRTTDQLKILGDAQTASQYETFITDTASAARPHVAGAAYWCHATRTSNQLRDGLHAAGYHESSIIAWVKQHFVMGRSDYHWQWEPIWYGWIADQDHYWIGDRNQGNVWEHADTPQARRASGRQRRKSRETRTTQTDVWRHARPSASTRHPTMKPVALVEHAIRNSSEPGRWILDIFAGSGSTLVAAENMRRPSYNIELDPRYADVIIGRYESLDGAAAAERIHKTTGRKEPS